ncbi:MAG: hypothetical protein ACXW2E_00220 [Nitrososphaeraceae archaeon]
MILNKEEMMSIGKTCAYTICKNEIQHIENWIKFTEGFDYRVLLDTGSTDGTYELLKHYPNVIIEQKIFDPWDFSIARNYNLDMIPDDVDIALSPDMDEWFSLNTLDVIQEINEEFPNWDCISIPRLDIYSRRVYVGPPHNIGSNKIHKLKYGEGYRYRWKSPIYEYLSFQPSGINEQEISTDKCFLIHNQQFSEVRPQLYTNMLIEQYKKDPTDTWCLWFLVNHYYIKHDLDNFIQTGSDFIRYEQNKTCSKYIEILSTLKNMYNSGVLSTEQQLKINGVI